MSSKKRSAKYHSIKTGSQVADRNEDQNDIEENLESNHSRGSNNSEFIKMTSTGMFNVKFKENHKNQNIDEEEEDVDFEQLGLRKYLEKRNIISVERPDNNPDRMGKKSKLDYIKELVYLNSEVKNLGSRDIIKESRKRLKQREIKESAQEEIKKKLEDDEIEEELYVDKSEDSFERKKSNMRNLM